MNTILPNGQPAQTRVPLEVAIQMIRNQQMEQQRTPALNRSSNSRAPQVGLYQIRFRMYEIQMHVRAGGRWLTGLD